MTAAGCPPVLSTNYDESKTNKKCVATNAIISQFIKDRKPGKILLHAVWDGYTDDRVLKGIEQTLAYIKAVSPASKVYLIGPVPQWKPTLPDFALRKKVSLSRETYLKMPLYPKLRELETKIESICTKNQIHYVSPLTRMCRQDECLVVGKVGANHALTAFDYGHLTEEGSDI